MGRCELSKKLALERSHCFHSRINPDRYPDARSLSEHSKFILPLHLLCYMESRHIIAFCTLRNELCTVKPVDKLHDIWHSSYKCSYMEACNEIR